MSVTYLFLFCVALRQLRKIIYAQYTPISCWENTTEASISWMPACINIKYNSLFEERWQLHSYVYTWTVRTHYYQHFPLSSIFIFFAQIASTKPKQRDRNGMKLIGLMAHKNKPLASVVDIYILRHNSDIQVFLPSSFFSLSNNIVYWSNRKRKKKEWSKKRLVIIIIMIIIKIIVGILYYLAQSRQCKSVYIVHTECLYIHISDYILLQLFFLPFMCNFLIIL